MSYWAACYSQFTAQQAIRMRTTIANENIVNKCLVPLNADLYSTNTIILVYHEWYLAAKNEINIGSLNAATFVVIGGGNGGNANKVINAGTKITLKPGTKVFPDAGQTRFFINPLCD